MTRDELIAKFPHASQTFLRANADPPVVSTDSPHRAAPSAIVERRAGAGPLAARQTQGLHPARVLIRVTSCRRRLIDEDNLCEKFLVDCCRYAGLLSGDSPAEAHIETCQEKVATKEEERTVIEIIPLHHATSRPR